MTLYSPTALGAAVGATYRQIHYWTAKGALKPVEIEGVPASGTGNIRIYDETELRIANALVALGSIEDLAKAVRDALLNGEGAISGSGLSLIPTPRIEPGDPS